VAAKNTNRDFIGMELDENYFEIAKKRIEETFNWRY
jgi:site-specific DNA-methyltransferase (adenine-specific)